MSNKNRLIVITGGPGSGKSMLVSALERSGFSCFEEAGRSVIQDQVNKGGDGVPWGDPLLFAELMLAHDIRSYHAAEKSIAPAFFDRGVVDVVGYLRLMGLAIPRHTEQAAATFRYDQRVFIAPPWEAIYEQDRERKQDFEEAVRTYEIMATVYAEYGYELIEIPRLPVAERLLFVLQAIGTAQK